MPQIDIFIFFKIITISFLYPAVSYTKEEEEKFGVAMHPLWYDLQLIYQSEMEKGSKD